MTGGTRLEDHLDRMSRGQLLRLAGRLGAPAPKETPQDVLLRDVRRRLGEERALDAFAASLTPSERALLGEVRRGGGSANGWALLTFARLRGLEPPEQAPLRELYRRHQPAKFEDAAFLTVPLSDGVLLPRVLPSPFLDFSYGAYASAPLSPDAENLSADERLLDRLPDGPAPSPVWAPPRAASPDVPPDPSVAPLLSVVELTRTLELGEGLPLTVQGNFNRTAVRRLGKNAPAVEDVEFWLALAGIVGALRVEGERAVLASFADLDARFLGLTPRERRAAFAEVAIDMGIGPLDGRLSRPRAARAALLHLLDALPHATTERDLVAAFERFAPRPALELNWRGKDEGTTLAAWATDALRGILWGLGLVALGMDGNEVVVASTVPADDTPPPTGPAWVLQPNFELLVYPHALRAEHLRVLRAAQARRFDAASATYRLTRESVYGALEGGLTLDALLAGLEGASATPLAPNVRATLADWAARRERVTLHRGATLLEFPDAAARDAHVAASGGRPVGETFALVPRAAPLPDGARPIDYDRPPVRTLVFLPDGRIRLAGPPDLFARHLLDDRADRDGRIYTLRPGPVPPTLAGELEARASNRMPDALRARLAVWNGGSPAPALADLVVLQHPQAAALASDPRLAPLLGPALSPSLVTVPRERRDELERALIELGLKPTADLVPATAAAPLEAFADTRKKREFIEEAIRARRRLLVLYQEERWSDWSHTVKPGHKHQEELEPLEVERTGTTPYLRARQVETGEPRQVRIGYILGMALR